MMININVVPVFKCLVAFNSGQHLSDTNAKKEKKKKPFLASCVVPHTDPNQKSLSLLRIQRHL